MARTKWEYYVTSYESDAQINDLGYDGWELVSVVPVTNIRTRVFFKRLLSYDPGTPDSGRSK